MNTKTRTVITDGRQEAGPFESEEAAWSVLPRHSYVLDFDRRTDGWYVIYVITTTTTTTLCSDHGIVSPIRTTTMPGHPGPFTKAEAEEFAASLDSSLVTICIIQGDDGWWYVSYSYKIATTLRLLDEEEYKPEPWWRRILRRARE